MTRVNADTAFYCRHILCVAGQWSNHTFIHQCVADAVVRALSQALTTCFGNVSEDQSSFNAMVVLEHAKALGTVPIYRGAKHPMVQGIVGGREGDGPEWSGHGADGLGGVGLGDRAKRPDVEVEAAFEREHAAVALARMASQDPGQVSDTHPSLPPCLPASLSFSLSLPQPPSTNVAALPRSLPDSDSSSLARSLQ
jgi:hypothetical protein